MDTFKVVVGIVTITGLAFFLGVYSTQAHYEATQSKPLPSDLCYAFHKRGTYEVKAHEKVQFENNLHPAVVLICNSRYGDGI